MKRNLGLLACVLLGGAYLLIWHKRLMWMGDDGFFLAGAARVLDGQAPYRDFSAHFTPGSFYVLAGALSICDSWAASRVLALLLILVEASAVFVIVRRLTTSLPLAVAGFAIIVAPAGINPVYSHHHVSAVLALVSVWAWWRWIDTGRLRWAAFAGVADGLVGWTSQNKGFLLACASIAVVFLLRDIPRRERWRTLGAYALGLGGVAGAFCLILTAQGAWSGFVRDCVLFVARDYTQSSSVPYGTTYASPGTSVVRWVPYAWYFLAPLVAFTAEAVLCVHRRRDRPWTALLMIQGWALWGSALHRPDFDHLHYAAQLPTALMIVQLWQLSRERIARPRAGWAAIALLVLAPAACVLPMIPRTRKILVRPRYEIRTARDNTWTPSEGLAQTVNALVPSVASVTGPGEPIFVFPHASLYYRFLDRPNATRHDHLLEGISSPKYVEETIESLERKKVRYVIHDTMWDRGVTAGLYPCASLDFQAGRLMDYVRANYEPELVLPTATLYRRKIPPASPR